MKYCEKCHAVSDQERCPLCWSKKLRPVGEEDFCLLTEKGSSYCRMLAEVFEEEHIQYAVLPYGDGTETAVGLPLKNCRLYVPFSVLEEARGVIKQIEDCETENLRKYLLEKAGGFFISTKLEKKLKKKYGTLKDADILGYCVNIVESAPKIVDEGGHYLFCYSDNVTLAINSETYEILSLAIKERR